MVPARLGRRARARRRRGRAAPALGARRRSLTVPVAWAIGRQLAGRRVALIGAALVAVNPLFVWYSQEARAYGLFVLIAALAMLCFVRALHEPTRAAHGGVRAERRAGAADPLLRRVPADADGAVAAARAGRARRARCRRVGALALVGLALLPLISAQGGHGTQWIGRWALSSRLQAIPQYYLTGYSGAPLGPRRRAARRAADPRRCRPRRWRLRGRAAASARRRRACPLPIAHRRRLAERCAARAALIALSIAACGVLAPIVLAAFGADYLAPRNLVGAMIPLTVLIADPAGAAIDAIAASTSPRLARRDACAACVPARRSPRSIVVAFAIVSIDVDLSPRLQRGNWRDVARALGRGPSAPGDHDRRAGRGAAGVLPAAAAQPRAPRQRARERDRRDRLRAAAPRGRQRRPRRASTCSPHRTSTG